MKETAVFSVFTVTRQEIFTNLTTLSCTGRERRWSHSSRTTNPCVSAFEILKSAQKQPHRQKEPI
jgi:hypothetical protein